MLCWLALPGTALSQMLAGGNESSFAVTRSGATYAWGGDAFGQLGFGRETIRTLPRQVSDWKVLGVALGYQHTLVLKTDGTLWAWGGNSDGQLGNGSTTQSSVPVLVGGGFRSVFTASSTSFAIKHDGTLWAWGLNHNGQLGDGTSTSRSRPVMIASGFESVAPGFSCTFAIKTDGSLWRWGYCGDKQGDAGPIVTDRFPVQIGTGYAAISASDNHVAAVKRDGSLWTWGSNSYGELGDGTTASSRVPVKIGVGFSSAAAGTIRTIALRKDGTLLSWGDNRWGTLGYGETRYYYPSPGIVGTGFRAIALEHGHAVALKTDGSVWTWGYNIDGRLGDGTTQQRTLPLQVATGFVAVAASSSFSGAIKADQTLWLWGNNDTGQLQGLPTRYVTPKRMPMDFVSIESSKDTAFGEFHSQSFGIRQDGSLWAWGDNRFGQLGDGTTTSRPSPVQVGTGFVQVAAGGHHTLGVKSDGSLWAWGENTQGELGKGNLTASLIPVRIGEGYTMVGARTWGSVALKRDGTVWTWGNSFGGLLGDGVSTTNRLTPGIVSGLTGVTAIVAVGFKTLALKSDGTVWAWGLNSFGVLGDGTTTDRSTPGRVVGLTQVTAIAASSVTSLALKAGGGLWTWGSSSFGTLGDGTTQIALVPKQIGTGFVSIGAGRQHVLALKSDGTVRSWGWNQYGQLGDGGLSNLSIPQPVVNTAATGFLSLTGSDAGNALDPQRVLQITGSTTAELTSTLTDLRAAGLSGDIYFTALLPPNSPLLQACQAGLCSSVAAAATSGTRARRGSLAAVAGSSERKRVAAEGAAGAMVVGSIGRDGFKQTGGTGYVQAESAYTGALADSGTLVLGSTSVLQDSNALICMGVTLPELSAKGQALLRPIASGSRESVRGVEQCAPVQTAATIALFRGESTGPVSARTVTAIISPLDEDRGQVRQVYSWAVTPNGLQYMQTGPDEWEPMTEPMRPAATITVPMTGSYRHATTRALDLSGLIGTLVFVGLGESWEQVRQLNKAGFYQTIQ